jgi:hypothetical protein
LPRVAKVDSANSEWVHSKGSTGQEINDILVVGFMGEVAHQFVRIRQRQQGDIYIENRYRPEGPHFSYHASGEIHSVYVDQHGKITHSRTGRGPPTSQFRGRISLGAWTIYAPDLPVWKKFTPDKDRKTRLVLRIDMARLAGNLGLNFWLFESGRNDLVEGFLKELSQMPAHLLGHLIVTDTKPWIVIVVVTV